MQSQKGNGVDKEIFLKAARFCAYQERTQNEVRKKLYEWNTDKEETEEIISYLVLENYINEERFAKTFAGGKFRIKKWGRRKIYNELKIRGLSPYCVQEGMKEIEDEAYMNTLYSLLLGQKKERDSALAEKQRLYRFVYFKGYEPELIREAIEKIFEESH